MEEVDNIIFPILKDIGCVLSSDVKSIKDIQSEHIYAITAACLNVIDPDRGLVSHLPTPKAARFRVANQVASIVKDMGFNGEMGYQNFLYPNEDEVRRLLSFLIDKIPRVDKSEEDQDAGVANSLTGRISIALQNFSQQKWTVYSRLNCSAPHNSFHTADLTFPSHDSGDSLHYYTQHQPWYSHQTYDRSMYIPSVFEQSTRDIVFAERIANQTVDTSTETSNKQFRHQLQADIAQSLKIASSESVSKKHMLDANNLSNLKSKTSSAFSRKTDFTQEKTVVTEPGMSKEEMDAKANEEHIALLTAREEELSALQSQLEGIVSDGKQKKVDAEQSLRDAVALEEAMDALNTQLADMENAVRVKKRVVDLLPNAHENVGRLEEMAEKNNAKLIALHEEWERVKEEMVQEHKEKQDALNARKDVMSQRVDFLKKMRQDIKDKVSEIRSKEDLYKQLSDEYESLPKNFNRQTYIQRISDIVKNIDRQKEEIDKILQDVKSLQREINAKSESVKRSFDVADEMIYQAAKVKKDPTVIQVYRNIVSLRSGFNTIIDDVEKTGKLSNTIRELQQKIEQLDSKNSSLNMDSVTDDLKQIKTENAELKKQIKELQT